MGMYRLGCCSSGPAFGATTEDGLDPDSLAYLARVKAAQAAEAGSPTTVAVESATDPAPAAPFPWGKLLGVSVGAGLVLHYLVGKKRRR